MIGRVASSRPRHFRWKEGRTHLGYLYRYLEPIMPRIPDYVLKSTVYLYRSEEAALKGERGGATAFLVYLKPTNRDLAFWELGHFYVVTARHVIVGGATWVRLSMVDGTVDTYEVPEKSWIPHPFGDDVTAAPMMPLEENLHDVRSVPADIFLTEEHLANGLIGPGDETFFIGRLASADGGARNQPSVRFGNLSMLPVPILNRTTGIRQLSFIVEARSLGGYSGSPVFAYNSGTVTHKGRIERTDDSELFLLGIDWCHLNDWQEVLREDQETAVKPPRWVRGNTGMAGVVPTWKLTELLKEPILKKQRDKDETELLERLKSSAEGTPDSDIPDNEFDRFENLARKLANTPKKEIDEKRKGDS